MQLRLANSPRAFGSSSYFDGNGRKSAERRPRCYHEVRLLGRQLDLQVGASDVVSTFQCLGNDGTMYRGSELKFDVTWTRLETSSG